MSELINNKYEKINAKSFSSDKSQQVYSVYSFKAVEKKLIDKYFLHINSLVLDVGCGYGRTTVPLVKMGFNVIGIDIVPRMIEQAKINNPEIDYRLMSAINLEFADNSIDHVLFSFNGIDYIYPETRRYQALSEINRVLKKDGYCILSSHNYLTLFTKLNLFSLKVIFQNLFTFRLFSNYIMARHQEGKLLTYFKRPKKQIEIFEKAGFQVVEILGKKYSDLGKVSLFESWPYYVLKKK